MYRPRSSPVIKLGWQRALTGAGLVCARQMACRAAAEPLSSIGPIDRPVGGPYIGAMPDVAPKAVVLLSGGLDSTTTLAIAKSQGFACHALSFDYGQRQRIELEAAKRVARLFEVSEHLIMSIDLCSYGGSALTDNIEVPKGRSQEQISTGQIPVTYVPARNTIFLAHALGWAETLGAFDIFIGANAIDYSGYPDCRPEYIGAFENLANLATSVATRGHGRFRIHAPLIRMTKAEIITKGTALGVDFRLTTTCYDPQGQLACGACDACLLRSAGFRAAGIPDPTTYSEALAAGDPR